ncbi:hypothetical protein ABK040_002472 [Willaertia magna]
MENKNSFELQSVSLNLLDDIYQLEKESYPEDEAATFDKLKFRIENANDLFKIYVNPTTTNNELIGFVCSTRTNQSILTHDTMSTHQPNGKTICIHSVVIKDKYRRNGIGSEMLKKYLNYLSENFKGQYCVLLSKEYLIKFYENVGFKTKGLSSVSHGKEQWYELEYYL